MGDRYAKTVNFRDEIGKKVVGVAEYCNFVVWSGLNHRFADDTEEDTEGGQIGMCFLNFGADQFTIESAGSGREVHYVLIKMRGVTTDNAALFPAK